MVRWRVFDFSAAPKVTAPEARREKINPTPRRLCNLAISPKYFNTQPPQTRTCWRGGDDAPNRLVAENLAAFYDKLLGSQAERIAKKTLAGIYTDSTNFFSAIREIRGKFLIY